MFAFLASLAGGLLSFVGGAASSVAGLATSALGGAAGVAGLTVSQQMAAIAEPGYYETGGVLGGVTASAVKTVDYLGNLAPLALGIYQQFGSEKFWEPAPVGPPAPTIPPVVIPTIPKAVLPTLSQQPTVMTVGPVAPEAPNYLLYIGLAVLALFLLRKK